RGDEPVEVVNAALKRCGIYDFFDPLLIVYEKKDSPAPFREAAVRAGCPPGECMFVGENKRERNFARQAGFLVVSQPQRALAVIRERRCHGINSRENNNLVFFTLRKEDIHMRSEEQMQTFVNGHVNYPAFVPTPTNEYRMHRKVNKLIREPAAP